MGRSRPTPLPILPGDGSVSADQLSAVMEFLDWRWADHVPSGPEIIAMVGGMIEEIVCDPSVASIESGGIRISRDESGDLRVCFEIDLSLPHAVTRRARTPRRAIT